MKYKCNKHHNKSTNIILILAKCKYRIVYIKGAVFFLNLSDIRPIMFLCIKNMYNCKCIWVTQKKKKEEEENTHSTIFTAYKHNQRISYTMMKNVVQKLKAYVYMWKYLKKANMIYGWWLLGIYIHLFVSEWKIEFLLLLG